MKYLRIIFLFAVAAALPAACATAPPPGIVIGWGNSNSPVAAGVPFYGWAEPRAYTNSILTSEPVVGAGHRLTNAVAVACGAFHGLALQADGRVAEWGWNALGQAAGMEAPSPERTTALVKVGGEILSNITAIAAGRTHSLALRSDGTVIAWGELNSAERASVPAGLSNVVAISTGWAYNLALSKDGTVTDWPRSRLSAPLSNVVAVATGPGPYAPSLALQRDGTIIQWGPNSLAEAVPTGLTNAVAIAAGGGHCLALRGDGTVEGWGDNSFGQATGARSAGAAHQPTGTVMLQGRALTNVVAIAAGDTASLALRRDGTIAAWGCFDHRRATVPAGLTSVVAIGAGENFCLAITTNANWALPKR